MRYLLDTCIFNWLLDGKCTISELPTGEYLVTHIQSDEIANTKDKARRNDLMRVLKEIPNEQIPTSVFVLGVSRLGQAELGDGVTYTKILDELNRLKRKSSNCCDSIIGATAHTKKIGLVTADSDFHKVMKNIIPVESLVLWEENAKKGC